MANLPYLCFQERVVFPGQSPVHLLCFLVNLPWMCFDESVFHSPKLLWGAEQRRLFHISILQLGKTEKELHTKLFNQKETSLLHILTPWWEASFVANNEGTSLKTRVAYKHFNCDESKDIYPESTPNNHGLPFQDISCVPLATWNLQLAYGSLFTKLK